MKDYDHLKQPNFDYNKEIDIDPEILDIEWLEQPRKMKKATDMQAYLKRKMDLVQEELDLVKAELDKSIRANPQAFGIGEKVKVTETVVTNTLIQQEEYKEAYHKYLDARYEYEVAKGAVTAFEQRKNSLENLVKLFGQNYFSGPKVPRNLTEEYNNKKQYVDKKIGTKLKRRRKNNE